MKGFAISETSFIIFLLTATRRLEADPFLHELFDEEHYTDFGLEYIENTEGLVDVLKRHYPTIAAPFVERKQSAFKPIYGPEKWMQALRGGIVDKKLDKLIELWQTTREDNDEYFAGIDDDDVFFDFDPNEVSKRSNAPRMGYGSIHDSIYFKDHTFFTEDF